MKENDNYNINGDLSENIIQDNTISLIKESLVLNDNKNLKRRLTVRKPPNEVNSEFVLVSISTRITTTNEILSKNQKSNEDMIIFEITGKTNLSVISWKIYKTPKQIRELFNQTKKELAKKNLIDTELSSICKVINDYTNGEIFKNLKKISDYIIYFYNKTGAKRCDSFRQELRISATSFIYENNGIKPFEGYAYKKAEPRCLRTIFKIFCFPCESCFFKSWNKRWIILKDDMICYLNDPNTLIGKNVYWFDENINITPLDETSLQITNLSRSLTLKFNSVFERDLWEKEINIRIEKIAKEITNNEYQSFTSQKINCGAKWFVDGHDYFEYLRIQLLSATESVFITDWFLSPELALKRPVNYNNFLGEKTIAENKKHLNIYNATRLMDIFYVLAKKGVKIYILLFCEPTLALAINSLYTKRTLQSLHPNIKITRHPKGTQSILWSHHEKLVIIDQKIAFVGGLDLCWGRYDTNQHPVVEEKNKYNTYYYPGCDYINERQVDLHNVEKFYEEQLPRDKMPRMPWHDVHTMVEGPIVSDIVRHFVERWNDARFTRRDNGLVAVGTSFSSDKIISNNKNNKNKNKIMIELQNKKYERQDSESEDDKEIKLDYINTVEDLEKINKKKLSKSNNPNMKISDDEIPMNDKSFDSDDDVSMEAKKISNPNSNKGKLTRRLTIFDTMKNKVKGKYEVYKNKYEDYKNKHIKNKKMKLSQKAFLTDENIQKDNTIDMDFKIQALRSVCPWSIGKKTRENSILQGYYKLIDNSKHYIYIENQFFITKSFSEEEREASNLKLSHIVKNEIGLHIRNRIEKAYEQKERFKVFIFVPLLPGFSGTPGESSTMNGVLKHSSQSIYNNKGMSLLELLYKKMGDEVEKYISFFSLRNHGTIGGIPVTEQVYIHSKLMIVDDEKVILGSANINDRSMKGNRDSEFGIIIEEEKKYESIMGENRFIASQYASTLRRHLMAEHLGINDNEPILIDPISDNLWLFIKQRANNNTTIYREIFDCFPDNKFTTFMELRNRKMIRNKEDEDNLKAVYESKINGVVGHIVEYPTKFLINENLYINLLSKESLVPEKNFT